MPNLYLYRECSKGVPQATPQLVEYKHPKSPVLAPHKVCVVKQSTEIPQRSKCNLEQEVYSPSSQSKSDARTMAWTYCNDSETIVDTVTVPLDAVITT